MATLLAYGGPRPSCVRHGIETPLRCASRRAPTMTLRRFGSLMFCLRLRWSCRLRQNIRPSGYAGVVAHHSASAPFPVLLPCQDRALKDSRHKTALALAGTELPLLLRGSDAGGLPLLDTTRIHVSRAVAAMLA